MVTWPKLSYVLAVIGWGSVFALSWLMVLGEVDLKVSFGFLVFFVIVALFASSVAADKRGR